MRCSVSNCERKYYAKSFCNMHWQKNRRLRLYNIWNGMKQRCYYPQQHNYHNYGDRGITVCDEWRDNFGAFRKWALENGYQDDLTIDRINNDGNYEPANCKWADWKSQQNNRRSNVRIAFRGLEMTLTQWAAHLGWTQRTVLLRHFRGWPTERMLTQPPRRRMI